MSSHRYEAQQPPLHSSGSWRVVNSRSGVVVQDGLTMNEAERLAKHLNSEDSEEIVSREYRIPAGHRDPLRSIKEEGG